MIHKLNVPLLDMKKVGLLCWSFNGYVKVGYSPLIHHPGHEVGSIFKTSAGLCFHIFFGEKKICF